MAEDVSRCPFPIGGGAGGGNVDTVSSATLLFVVSVEAVALWLTLDVLSFGDLLDGSASLDIVFSGKSKVGCWASAPDGLRDVCAVHAETIRSNKLGSSEDSTIDIVRRSNEFKGADTYVRYVSRLKMGRWEDERGTCQSAK